ncbi:unnamed protein product [Durusdinium trenchii]|uniref:Uncharacterized protein n=2 Tax=Durusdinium trenchii TaxID=1381693 RepID=A0ABP0IUM5_9DINO
MQPVPKGTISLLFRRCVATCVQTSAQLRLREDPIAVGLQKRLLSLPKDRGPTGPFRVAVLGQHDAELAATLRAVRRAGATAAPADVSVYDTEELTALLAEAQVHMAVLSNRSAVDRVQQAMRPLGKQLAVAEDLAFEGAGEASATKGDLVPSMLLFARSPSTPNVVRAVEVEGRALEARRARAAATWQFTQDDIVLSLGLTAGETASVVDAVEAPLEAGSSVEMARGESIWDFWSALDETSASIVFVNSKLCWRLVQSHQSLAAALRQRLRTRSKSKPLRCVALAPPGTVISEELGSRWQDMFNCPLTWHFSCAEAGALFTVQKSEGESPHVGHCAPGLEWRMKTGDLHVRGKGLFSKYWGRPRSTQEAFDEDGFFCKTGHRAKGVEADAILPLPALSDRLLDEEANQHLTKTPNADFSGPFMRADWKNRKVRIRTYQYWKANWGGVLVTKKHNPGKEVYKGKYK